MKTIILKSVVVCGFFTLLLSFASCSNELEKELIFNYEITTSETQTIGDTLVIKKSLPLKFNLSGNYDFLSFYSGEIGHEYAKHDIKSYAKDDINTSVLSFDAKPQYGSIAGTLRVFISESFQGLQFYNTKLDSIAIATHNWVEITEQCNLPTTSTQVMQTSLSLVDYCDKDISLAFLYKTNQNTASQPTWEIKELKITNTLKNGTISVVKAVDLGFSALDMFNLNGQTATSGVWILSNFAAMSIKSSPVGAVMNEDWLISTPSKINRRLPDTAVAIGDIATTTETFSYKYSSAGIYNVTFVAKKANLENKSDNTKTLIVKVID